MSRNISISIPSERFDVDVVLCPDESLSHIERLVIRAIMAGENDLDGLASLFGLGRRIMLDLVLDLWRSDYLYLNISSGTVHVVDDIQKKMNAGQADEIDGARRETISVSLVHDLFTDRILPVLYAPTGGGNPISAPPIRKLGSYRDVSLTKMSDVVEQALARKQPDLLQNAPSSFRRKARKSSNKASDKASDKNSKNAQETEKPKRIIGIALRGAGELAEADRPQTWDTRIEIQVEKTEIGRFVVRVVQPDDIDGRIRRDWEERLAREINDNPDSWFATRLRDRVGEKADEEASDTAKSLPDLFQEIEEFQKEIAEFDLEKNAQPFHGKWRGTTLELIAQLNRCAAHRVRVDSIEPDNLDKTLLEAIGQAKHQLVLSSPDPDHERFLDFYNALEQALKRGVRVFLFRDVRTDREMDRGLLSAFNDLEGKKNLSEPEEKRRPFFWVRPNVPARTNERFLIRDREKVIFTTARFLDKHQGTQCAFMVSIRGLEDKAPCEAAADLLERTYRHLPNERLWNNFLQEPGGARSREEYLIPGEEKIPNLPRPPKDTNAEGELQTRLLDVSVRSWREKWDEYARALSEQYTSLMRQDIARPIFDSEHGELLAEILTPGSTRHLLIASGSASYRVLTPKMKEQIRECADDDMKIVLLLGRELREDEKSEAEYLEELRRDCPGFEYHVVPGCGGLLLSDKKLLITSVDLLAKDTLSEAPKGKRQLESGLLFTGPGLLSRLRRALAEMHPRLAKFISQVPAEEPAKEQEIESFAEGLGEEPGDIRELLDTIIDVLSDIKDKEKDKEKPDAGREDGNKYGRIPRIMENWFRKRAGQDIYWQYLDKLSEPLKPDPELFRMAAARALMEATDTRKEEEGYSRWLAWLAAERWQDRRFVEALLLMEYGNLTSEVEKKLPPRWIADLAAYQDGDELAFTRAMLNAQEKGAPTSEEIDALLCIAASALLIRGMEDAHEVILMFKDKCRSSLADWIGPVFEYWNSIWKPLPQEALRNQESANRANTDERDAFEKLQVAFSDAKQIDSIRTFYIVQDTWRHLFASEGEYGQIDPMLKAKDSGAVRGLLERWETQHMEPKDIMDDASKQVWIKGGSISIRDNRIKEEKGRRKCLNKLDTLENAMRKWVEAKDSLVKFEDDFLIRCAEQLADELRASRPAIDELLFSWQEAKDFRAPLLCHWCKQMNEILGV
uniref:Uncharacterized protein n=1 Tax=Candidatus Kentrum sp. LPFa TaxID=2126335 RepID=A0A450WC68_9GAMM|nr:MAG: hypothetical protein BECKLPF1236B_GA0070989_10654 [Candidatus Kentron sp. LPFa]